MTIPKKNKMPDLSRLTRNNLVSMYIIASLAGADRDLDEKFILYRKIFVRLVDKAIYEYSLVRKNVINQINARSGEIYIFLAMDHLENCINSVRRLFNLFDRIKSIKKNPFTIDKVLRKLINSNFSKVKDVRNFIEHIDEDIQKGIITKSQPIALKINEDASKVSIGESELSLIDLSILINKFYVIGSELARYNAKGVNHISFKAIRKK